jgi:hypothetical protein
MRATSGSLNGIEVALHNGLRNDVQNKIETSIIKTINLIFKLKQGELSMGLALLRKLVLC